jgi:arylsulfatase A-like enzyme
MSSSPPNILMIIADDFGIHQLGCTTGGTGFFVTPHLDQLAAEGVRFTSAYATAPVCSPARASLYTGVHAARLHLTEFIPGSQVFNPPLLEPAWQRGLPVAAETLGDALKEQGYATAHFGKWHLAPDYNYSPGRPMDPESQGFDDVMVTRKPSPNADPEADPHQLSELTKRAINFCSRARKRPFFCVVAHNMLHRPEIAPAALVAKYAAKEGADPECNRPVLGAMVEQLDASIGRLLAALRRSGRDRDTLVVFTADHGPLGACDGRRPLRGSKATLYEGGLRIPLLMRWPGRIQARQVRDTLVSGADLFPTLLTAAGVTQHPPVDGLDLWPVIERPTHPLPRSELCWHYPHYHHQGIAPCGAIRIGDFKLIEWFEPVLRPPLYHDGTPYELYNLALDPVESRNLADDDPARRDALLRQLHKWRAAVGAQMMHPNPGYDPAVPTRVLPPPGDAVAVVSK